MWIRRSAPDGGTCSLRFQVDQGKGVLRVSRPGVLIVPPARNHGHEDHLAPAQLRSSLFLHVPGPGRPRQSYSLDSLTDAALAALDLDIWYELSVVAGTGGESRLDFIEDQDIIALGGDVAPAYELPSNSSDLAAIGQIVDLVTGHRSDQEELIEDVIEVDSETARSEAGFVLFQDDDSDVPLLGGPASVRRVERAPPPVHDSRVSLPPPPLEPLPAAQAPSAQAPSAQAPSAQAPTAQAPTAQGPSAQGPSTQGPSTQGPPDEEQLRVFPGGPRKLARHLRRQLDRQVVTIVELEERIDRLERRLRDLGEDPEAL